MIFEFHIPAAPLDLFIESILYLRDDQDDVVHRIERLLPDGNVVLIIDLTDSPKYIYDEATHAPIQTCKKAWFSGIQSAGLLIPAGQQCDQLVITFKKGKSFPFLRMPLTEVAGVVVDTDLVMANISRLREAALHSPTPRDKVLCAEQFFLREYLGRLEENACVDHAINRIVAAPDSVTMSSLSDEIGYSQKHFIHLFKHHVGVAPKSFMRIMRFNKTLTEINATQEIDWTALALDCGYYDQSHFISDFKKFSGYTPEEYASMPKNYPGYVPVA